MLISVIIPVYNVQEYLSQCLDSVINQTYKNLEIICVNDASTDGTWDKLQEFKNNDRVKLLNQEKNSGKGAALIRGFSEASARLVLVQDADFDSIGVKAVSSYLLINAPHMIFSPETVFTVKEAAGEGEEVTLCADGRSVCTIKTGDTLKIRRSPNRLKLIFLKPKSNMEVFFRKF